MTVAAGGELRGACVACRCLGALAHDECRLSQGRGEPIVVRLRLRSAQAMRAHFVRDPPRTGELALQHRDGGSVDTGVADICRGPAAARILVCSLIDAKGGAEVLGTAGCIAGPERQILVGARQDAQRFRIGVAGVGELAQQLVGPLGVTAAGGRKALELSESETLRPEGEPLLHRVVGEQRLTVTQMPVDGVDRLNFCHRASRTAREGRGEALARGRWSRRHGYRRGYAFEVAPVFLAYFQRPLRVLRNETASWYRRLRSCESQSASRTIRHATRGRK